MLFNINLHLLKNQQKSFILDKGSIDQDFLKTDLVSIETRLSILNALEHRTARLCEIIFNMAASGCSLYMSHDWLAWKLNCTRQWVIEMLKRLRDLGIITWISGKSNYTTNVYFVCEALLTHEAIRRLKSKFIGAQMAWMRRLWMFVKQQPIEEFTPIRSYILKSECRSECISVEVSKSTHTSLPFSKRKREMQYQNAKVYEEFENNHGITISPNAKAALDGFDGTTVKESLLQAKRLEKVNFGYVIGTCNGKYKDANRKPERVHISLLRNHLGIDEDDDKTISYDPMSDNFQGKNSTNGKAKGSGTKTSHTPDEQGWTYGVMPDGTRVRSRPFQGRKKDEPVDSGEQKIKYVMDKLASGEWYTLFPDRELADKTAQAMIAAAKAQIAGDEDLKRKIFFEHLTYAQSSLHKNSENLNTKAKSNPIHDNHENLSL